MLWIEAPRGVTGPALNRTRGNRLQACIVRPTRQIRQLACSSVLLLALGLLGLAGAPGGIHGQLTSDLVETCNDCRIAVDTVAVLGDGTAEGSVFSEIVRIELDPDGGGFFLLTQEFSLVQIFSRDGEFESSLGGPGEGPGEFDFPQAHRFDEEGRLHVIDPLLGRISVFNRALELDHTVRLEGIQPGFELYRIRGDSIVLAGYARTGELFGLPMHVLTSDGTLVRSFGEPDYPIESPEPSQHLVHFALSDGSEVWLGRKDRYQLELWTLEGEHRQTYRREVSWMVPPDPVPDNPPPPAPLLTSIGADPEGLAWAVFAIAGDRWEEAAIPGDGAHGFEMVEPDLWRDTVVEVVDMDAGTILASHRFSDRFTNLFSDPESKGVLTGIVEVDEVAGTVRAFVIRLRLERP